MEDEESLRRFENTKARRDNSFIDVLADVTKQIVTVNDNLDVNKEYFENIIVIKNTHS